MSPTRSHRMLDTDPRAPLADHDDIASLRSYLDAPSFRYVDQALAVAHAEALARWPLLEELLRSAPPTEAADDKPALFSVESS